jgi:hypothetical protein
MGALPQGLKIIFEMQRKRTHEKVTKRKISFSAYKILFFFLLFEPLLLPILITFLFLIHFNQFKVL